MKTKTANILVTVQAVVASATEEQQFRIWFDHHGKAAFEKWKHRNKYNRPTMSKGNGP